ncbi:MAG: nucleotidyltransferase [Bacteroidetes bacterium]|nr:nucleotidyltransferase [Bacteroidota bacterium]
MVSEIITKNLSEIEALCVQYRVKHLFVFGSAASENFNDESDVDLIVKFDPELAVEDHADLFFDLVEKLEALFKRKVDLLTDRPIKNKYLKLNIEASKQMIYAA